MPPAPPRAPAKVDKTPPPLTPTETVWGLALNNLLTMPPAYDGTQGFFAIEQDRLVAYELVAGKQQWITAARPVVAPVAGGGLVFVVESNTLRTLHGPDGSIAWELPFSDPLAVPPVWDNGWLIVATAAGEIRAYRASDGELIWRRDLTTAAHASPALAGDRVYVPTTDGRIVALRVETGEPLWERRLGGAPNEILALNERLYVGAQDNFFYCVMAVDGQIDWRWRTGNVIGRPVADERYVYFVALDNVLRAMNLVTGGQQWMRPLPIRPGWGAVRAGSTIVVSGQATSVHAFNIKGGTTAGTFTGVATEPPVVAAAGAEPAAPAKAPAFAALATGAELAAAPYVMEHPLTRSPLVLLLFTEIGKGASATLVGHSHEPTLIPGVSPLPNLIQIAPVTPTTPPRP